MIPEKLSISPALGLISRSMLAGTVQIGNDSVYFGIADGNSNGRFFDLSKDTGIHNCDRILIDLDGNGTLSPSMYESFETRPVTTLFH